MKDLPKSFDKYIIEPIKKTENTISKLRLIDITVLSKEVCTATIGIHTVPMPITIGSKPKAKIPEILRFIMFLPLKFKNSIFFLYKTL